ncbi:MAG: hypothetical protein EOP06_05585 [Proteobacteria bacterium]|nr:MAG: hypothetical protein EOP06_05585 [Pseudomonadota bacterium]
MQPEKLKFKDVGEVRKKLLAQSIDTGEEVIRAQLAEQIRADNGWGDSVNITVKLTRKDSKAFTMNATVNTPEGRSAEDELSISLASEQSDRLRDLLVPYSMADVTKTAILEEGWARVLTQHWEKKNWLSKPFSDIMPSEFEEIESILKMECSEAYDSYVHNRVVFVLDDPLVAAQLKTFAESLDKQISAN